MIALMMTATLMFNVYKASAVAVPVGYLAYLIEAVTEMLVGSGTCTQAQIRDMNTSELFETAKGVAPSIDWSKNSKMKANVIENVNKFINDVQLSSLNKSGIMENIVDWIYGNANTLAKINPELKGYGAMCFFQIMSEYSSSGIGSTYVYFGDYGIVKKGKYAQVYGSKVIKQYTDNYHGAIEPVETVGSGAFSCGGVFDSSLDVRYKFVGDWRYEDGTPATDMLTFADEVPEAIGTVDIDGTTYDVNGDGTVTIGDKTIPINDDGTVTVDGKPYNPDYDVSPYPGTSIGDLITTIINNIDVVDDTTDDDIDDILDNVEAPAIGVDALDEMILPKTIFTVFPFCLPRDFVRGMQLFSAKPETPHFECEIKVPAFLNIPAQTWNIVIDLERFETLARITRWLSFISFSFLLIQLSATIVKGAH